MFMLVYPTGNGGMGGGVDGVVGIWVSLVSVDVVERVPLLEETARSRARKRVRRVCMVCSGEDVSVRVLRRL